MFREGNVLLYEQPELVDETLYFSVLNAIAGGACRRSEIASRLGRPDSSLSHPLAVLEEVRLIERVEDALVAKRPVYRIAEPVIRFHQLVIRPREAAIAGLGGDRVWPAVQDTVDAKIYGPHFEQLCREWTLVYAADAAAAASSTRCVRRPSPAGSTGRDMRSTSSRSARTRTSRPWSGRSARRRPG
ncbi:ATP-binding protein [Catellatospora coxensis]